MFHVAYEMKVLWIANPKNNTKGYTVYVLQTIFGFFPEQRAYFDKVVLNQTNYIFLLS